MKLLPIVTGNPDYTAFKRYVNGVEVLHGLDDKLETEDGLAHNLVNNL
jgi:hypothetical protein